MSTWCFCFQSFHSLFFLFQGLNNNIYILERTTGAHASRSLPLALPRSRRDVDDDHNNNNSTSTRIDSTDNRSDQHQWTKMISIVSADPLTSCFRSMGKTSGEEYVCSCTSFDAWQAKTRLHLHRHRERTEDKRMRKTTLTWRLTERTRGGRETERWRKQERDEEKKKLLFLLRLQDGCIFFFVAVIVFVFFLTKDRDVLSARNLRDLWYSSNLPVTSVETQRRTR